MFWKLPRHNEDGEQEVELVRLEQPGPVPVQDAPEHAAVTHRQVNPEMEFVKKGKEANLSWKLKDIIDVSAFSNKNLLLLLYRIFLNANILVYIVFVNILIQFSKICRKFSRILFGLYSKLKISNISKWICKKKVCLILCFVL